MFHKNKSKVLKPVFIVFALSFISACSDGTTPNQTEQLIYSDSSNTPLSDRIRTGADSHQHQSYWLCDIQNADDSSENFVLQFWDNNTGVAGTKNIKWQIIDNESIFLDWTEASLSLLGIVFSSNRGNNDNFTAYSDKNDNLSCELNGPVVNNTNILADYANHSEQQVINDANNPNDIWRCEQISRSGNTLIREIAFWNNGIGTDNNVNFNWFYNDDDNIILSYADSIKELRDIKFSDNSNQPNEFAAFENEFALACTR